MTQPQKNLAIRVARAPVGLISGATYPFQALVLMVRNPNLWGYILFPVLANAIAGLALYVGLLLPGLKGIDRLTLTLSARLYPLLADLPRWLSWLTVLDNVLEVLLQIVLILGLLLLTGFVLVQFGTVLGSPWYGQLSEQLEKLRLGEAFVSPPEGLGNALRDIWRAIAFELKKLFLVGGLGAILLLLNLIPALGTVAASFGGIAIAALTFGLDFLDASLERRRVRFREKLATLLTQLPASGSFSLACFFLCAIPVVNFLTIPLCVAGGTLFFCDRIWPARFASEGEVRSETKTR
ncbi:EI24 domain-containing protein [Oscillatoriales cyanobacterium LEGE 11467]|uniref:EI24 domain-containing protein n=1 Tax=Zarconia navalis LEGE 11467 TaxID=1828826 RepID=A0A928VWI9_9CYAN|nr:EI24 domain-containing protein [Zarconia navalis]MBE9040593.1 EI24 domain-containing protein [Zarconia navalis LEGE 11467]